MSAALEGRTPPDRGEGRPSRSAHVGGSFPRRTVLAAIVVLVLVFAGWGSTAGAAERCPGRTVQAGVVCVRPKDLPAGEPRAVARWARKGCPPGRGVVLVRVVDGGLAGPYLVWGYGCR